MSDRADTIRVLHVDDEPGFGDMVGEFLAREDDRIDVQTATSPDEGLTILADGAVDCIISDYDMPQTNGIEFLETVRADHPDLPFILYTGKGSEEVASDAISAGVTDYLQKEAGSDQYTILANRVVNAVERYWIEQEAGQTRTQLQAISENSTDAIMIIDSDSRIRFANPAVEEHFGYTPSELRDEPLTTIMPERYRESHLDAVDRYLATGERTINWSNAEFPGQHRDGTEIPLSISFSEFQQNGEQRFIGIIRDISERTRLEAELREREQRFRQLAENIQEVVWMSDPEKEEMIYVNPAYENIWGQSVDSLYENPTEFLEAVHPEDRDRVEDALETQITGEYDVEYRIVRPDGERRWIRDQAVPVRNDAGEVYRIVGIASDITERKRQEHKREQVIERVTDAIVEVDADWRFTLVNEQAEVLYDMDEEYLLGRDFWEVFSEAKGTRFEEEYRRVMETREPTSFVEYFTQLDGWFDIEAYPKDDGGIVFYFIEVTDQRERRDELEEINAVLSTLFETLPVGVTVLDTDGRITRANRRAEEVLGLTESEITDRTYNDPKWEIIDEDGEPIPDDDLPFAQVMATGEAVYDYEHGIRLPDGRERWLSTNAAPIRPDGDEIEQVVAVITDITDDREYERALERQNERLEEFTSVVSHDLRNPLNVAQGRLELARTESDSEHLDAVGRALERMEVLITDLLILAREGETAVEMTSVALGPHAETCWTNVDTKDATLVVDVDVDRSIRADASRLSQLFENLIRNSVEHGGSDVTVTVGELENGFYVEDDGPGIPADKRDDVFGAGYTTSERGTGFGLSIVKQIVEAHGWTIRIAEGIEGGARFEITGVEFVD